MEQVAEDGAINQELLGKLMDTWFPEIASRSLEVDLEVVARFANVEVVGFGCSRGTLVKRTSCS